MTDQTEQPVDKAALTQGAASADLDPATQSTGNPAPPAPSNEPPKEEATGENKADDKQQTPAEASKPEDGKDPPKDDPKSSETLNTDIWGSTGDEVGDSVLLLLQNSGIDTADAKALLYDAMNTGDVTSIDKAALVEKVGKAQANLIIAGCENFAHRNQARARTILGEVHSVVGGAEAWSTLSGWARENIPEADLGEYRALIDAGGAKARFAAHELAVRYNADSKNSTLNPSEIPADALAAPAAKALTRAEYVAAIEKAHDSGASQTTINEINAARARGRARGI